MLICGCCSRSHRLGAFRPYAKRISTDLTLADPFILGHAHIEAEEDSRERKYKGLAEDADLDTDRAVHDPLDEHAHGSQDPPVANDSGKGAQQAFVPTAGGILPRRPDGSAQSRPARIDRSKPDLSGKENWAKEAKNRPGYGESDFHRPRNAEDRLRKGVPYSSCFRALPSDDQTLICLLAAVSHRIQIPRAKRVLGVANYLDIAIRGLYAEITDQTVIAFEQHPLPSCNPPHLTSHPSYPSLYPLVKHESFMACTCDNERMTLESQQELFAQLRSQNPRLDSTD